MLERLARLRVALGFVGGAIVLWLAEPTWATLAPGVAVASLGEALRLWAAGHLNKSREVTTSGPYRWLAHPLYAGSSIIGLGLAIGSGNIASALVIAVYLATTITAAIRREEASLAARFGEHYERYRRAGEVDRGRPFSMTRAMANHEHRALMGFVLAVLLLVLKAKYR